MKKTLSLLLVLAMVLSSFGFAFAAEDEVNPAEFLKEQGIFIGDGEDQMLEKNFKRQDTIVMLSRLLGAEEEAKAFEGEISFTDVPDPYYVPFIAWAEAEGLTEGVGDNKFGFDQIVTEQEVAKFMLTALDYEVKWEDVTEKAIEIGLVEKDADLTKEAKRSVVAELIYKALGLKMKDSEKTLAEHLEIEMPVPAKLEVEDVVADNLKEIKVVFNKEVNEDFAIDKDLYTTTAGEIKGIRLVEDGKVVIIALEDGDVMKNKAKYELTIKGVRDEKTIIDDKFSFQAIDNEIPRVEEVVALGTKVVKVTMSEPVKAANTRNFKLDGKSLFGSVNVEGREIFIKPFDSKALEVGEHELVVTGLVDYNNFKSIETVEKFEVIEDKDAPTVVEVRATLERVEVTFSEDVDPDTVTKDSVYWKAGSSKKKADKIVTLAGNKYAFEFTTNSLPVYETTIYVEGVKDYSGNAMAAFEKLIKATIDETRPEVISAKLLADNKTIEVKFNKTVNGGERKYYTLKDEDGKVISIKKVTPAKEASKAYELELYSTLDEGDFSLKITGVRDTTRLENMMIEEEVTLTVGDTASPTVKTVTGHWTREEGNVIYVLFNKAMDMETIGNPANYLIKFNRANRALPEDAIVEVVQNGKGVKIYLPDKIDGKVVELDKNLTHLTIMAVKDLSGNVLENYSVEKRIAIGAAVLESYNPNAGISEKAAALDRETIKVRFNQPIVDASKSAFNLVGGTVKNVIADGSNVVTIKTAKMATDLSDITSLSVRGEYIETITGNVATNESAGIIADCINPEVYLGEDIEVLTVVQSAYNEAYIELPFSEELNGVPEWFANDLVVVMEGTTDETLTARADYRTDLDLVNRNVIKIKLNYASVKGNEAKFRVSVKDDAKYIMDVNENMAEAADPMVTESTLDFKAPVALDAVVSVDEHGNETVVIVTFDEEVSDAGSYTIGTETKPGEIDDNDPTKVTITFTHPIAENAVITIQNVKDLIGNNLNSKELPVY